MKLCFVDSPECKGEVVPVELVCELDRHHLTLDACAHHRERIGCPWCWDDLGRLVILTPLPAS